MFKKRGFLFLVALILLPSVFALDLTNIPILLWVPSVLILLVITIFIIMMIKDRLAMKSLAIPTFDNVGKKEIKPEKEIKEIPREKKVKKIKEAAKEKEAKKEIDYYSKINDIEQRLNKMDTRTAYKEFMKIVREFFSDYLNLNYQFTNEELEEELKKRKEKIFISSKELSKIEYSQEPIPKNELIKIIEELKNLIKKVQPPKLSLEFSRDAKKIKRLITKGNKTPKKDKAIHIYKRIYSLYYKLPKGEKSKLHNSILEFYKLIS